MPAGTLRAWERRYGIVEPSRDTSSGYRLYSEADERRVRRMLDLVGGGLAPAEAARRIKEDGNSATRDDGSRPAGGAPATAGLRESLSAALSRFDDRAADEALDRAVTVLSTDALVNEILLPVLRGLEEDSIGQEHFASNLLRGRLLALARGWGGGDGRLALLACPSGELHDLGLIAFGLALRDRGWRIAFLGADTPVESLVATAERIRPEMLVLSSTSPEPLSERVDDLRRLSQSTTLMLAGPGVSDDLCTELGAIHMARGPVEEAAALSV